MPSGILGRLVTAVDTNAVVYTVPADKMAVCNISICNTGGEQSRIRIALSDTGTPVAGDYIEYDYILPPNGSMERTGIVLDAGKNIVAMATTGSVNVVIFGMEE